MRPPAPPNPDPERLDWVWLEPIRVGDEGFPAGFPSTTNAELERDGPRWVLTQGYYVADWVEAHCVFSDGRWIGQPFELQPWQVRLLVELFEVSPATLLRRYRWALVGLPKKNGKTELAAALGLYMELGDEEPAAFVVCAAASDAQADLVFGAANTMVTMSESLQQVMVAEARRITVPSLPRVRLERVAAAAGTNDGKNIHCVICDELHEWLPGKHEQVWNVLTNGLGARRQPMVIQITTAGSDEGTVAFRQYDLVRELLAGTKSDDTTYGVWFEAPERHPRTGEKLAYDSEDAVRFSNPSYGVTVEWAFFADQLKKKTEAVYRRYFLNQWTEADEIWEGAQHWDENQGEPELVDWLPVYVGIDVSNRHDATAVVVAQWREDRGRCQLLHRIWENPFGPRSGRHDEWRLDLGEVETFLRDVYHRFPEPAREDEEGDYLPGPAFFYDPMLFERSAQALRNDGLNLLEYPQSEQRMVAASQRFFELLKNRQIEHDGDPLLRQHVRSSGVKETGRGWRITRTIGTRRPNDGCIAGAIAAYEATRGLEDEYDEAPVLTLGGPARPEPALSRAPQAPSRSFLNCRYCGALTEPAPTGPEDVCRPCRPPGDRARRKPMSPESLVALVKVGFGAGPPESTG